MVTRTANTPTADQLSRFNYELRGDGRRTGLNEVIQQPDGTTRTRALGYDFDEADRLTGETGTDGTGTNYSKTYTLDAVGNRLSLSENRGGPTPTSSVTTYNYNELDWLTQTTKTSTGQSDITRYGYDQNGSQTGITTNFGETNQATTAQKRDFEGHFCAVTSGTSYIWEGDRLAEERDEDGVVLSVYEHSQELGPLRSLRPAHVTTPLQERFFIGDGQDSTRLDNCSMPPTPSKTPTSTTLSDVAYKGDRATLPTPSSTPDSSRTRRDSITCGRDIMTQESEDYSATIRSWVRATTPSLCTAISTRVLIR